VNLFATKDLAPLASAEGNSTDKGFIAPTWLEDGEYLYGAGENRGGRYGAGVQAAVALVRLDVSTVGAAALPE
jgi:hypothetical protein